MVRFYFDLMWARFITKVYMPIKRYFLRRNPRLLGTIYYVRPHGNDRNDGLTYATAWKTLKNVNKLDIKEGDVIEIGAEIEDVLLVIGGMNEIQED